MESSLEHLVQEGVLTEVIGRLKSGKEADVYVVRYGGEIVAAKVYKDRAQRSFKNNSAYKEGRSVRNSRSQRAMDSGSKFGKAAEEDAWKAAEAATLYKLHAAGVRVPTPVMFLEGVLLMELVLGADGEPAPRVIDVDLTPEEAHAAYLDMLSQLVRILSCDLIHGDLSPYNVLWGESGPTIIDFPQIVSASANSNSENFFLRDARNVLGHFVAIDPSLRARFHGDAREIWRAYVRRDLTPDFLPSGRPPPQEQPRPRVQERDRRPPAHDNRPHGPQGSQGDNRPRGPGPQHHPHDGRNAGSHQQRPRGPQEQNDGRHAGPHLRPRGPQGPSDGRPRGPNDGRGQQNQGNRPARSDNFRGSAGGQRRPAPEVIVMTRRSPAAAPPAEGKPSGQAGPAPHTRGEAPPRHRPRGRT